MRKNLLILPVAVIAMGLSSCKDKNIYTINSSKHINFTMTEEGESFTFDTFGITNFTAKKGVTYTFIYDFSSADIKHNMNDEFGETLLNGFAFGFDVDVEGSSVKLNDKELVGLPYEERTGTYDFTYGKIDGTGELGNAIEFNQERFGESPKFTWRNTDKLTIKLKCKVDISNVTICGIYIK